jgi:hypothetical protein
MKSPREIEGFSLFVSMQDLLFAASLFARSADRPYVRQWWRGRAPDFPLTAQIPWIVYPALAFLERRPLAGARVFEYGSGGSTLYWARRGATQIVSVEHDRVWHAAMRPRAASWPAVDLRFVPPQPDPQSPAAARDDPSAYRSDTPAYEGLSFADYARSIDQFPEGFFDVVLVDGRARPACIKHAANKVARGGLMIVDNAEREYYFSRTQQYLSAFSRTWFEGPGPVNRYRWSTLILTHDGR